MRRITLRRADIHRATVLLAATLAVAIGPGQIADAHTELDFTLPADGTTVGDPVTEISVGFTEAVTLVGNGFEVLDPQGNVLQPFVVTDDNVVFRLQLDPPLAGGAVGVRYEVTSDDGHVVEGSFSFTAAAEPPPPTTAPVATSIPVTAPATTVVPPPSAVVTTAAPAVSTLPPTTTTAPATTVAVDPEDESSDDTTRTVLIVVLVVAALGSAVFLVIRSRRTP